MNNARMTARLFCFLTSRMSYTEYLHV
uniref:Uncharacterized protein n=1 Tax=Arundo donax TaxID=35708 RepID=A0A0A9CC88_ARUDO